MSTQVPSEFKSSTPDRLRHYAKIYRQKFSAEVQQTLLDAAAEIEGSEKAFARVVEQNHDLQKDLTRTESLLRSAYDTIGRQSGQAGEPAADRQG